nr:hypothetical protein [Tanacetum cinerariifolium]
MDQNNDSFGLDRIQSLQYPEIHHPSQADVEEVIHDKEKFMQDTQTFLEKFNRFSFEFTLRVLTIAWERIDKIKYVLTEPEEIPELMYKLQKSPDAFTTILPTEEPEHSLSMGYEHLSTTPETELDEVIESSVKNLLPIPSECEVTSEDKSECDMPAKDESSSIFMTFSNPLFDDNDDLNSSDDESLFEEEVPIEEFKIYSNPLFDDEEINFDKIDPHPFNSESEFVESLSNRDTLIESSSKFDFLEEFSGAFLPTRIAEEERIKREHAEYISRIEMLVTINPRPRPTVNANTNVESIPSSFILIQDNDSHTEEIDIVTNTDDVLPPRVENDDDSDGEIDVVEELYVDNSIFNFANKLSDNEASNFDNPSFPRPPPEPPDAEFNFKPYSKEEIPVVMNEKDEFDESLENSSTENAVSNSNPEKEETPQEFDIRQLIREECCVEVSDEQKKNMEDTMLELVKICKEKELLCMHDNVDDLIESDLNTKLLSTNSQRLDKKEQKVKNVVEQPAERGNRKEPEHSLSMRYEHLSTTPETESDEVTESSAKNLLPFPSECEVTLKDESKCDMPIQDQSSSVFTTFSNPLFKDNDDLDSSDNESLPDEDVSAEEFKIYSNPFFDNDEVNSDKLDPHCFNVESDFVESLLNCDTFIDSSPESDFLLKEFSGELAHINPKIKEADFDFEEEIRLIENLMYDNSSPRPPKELNAKIADTIIENLPSLPIPVQNEREINAVEELLNDNSISLTEDKSPDSDHKDNPSVPRPPSKPPDAETDAISVVMNDELKCLNPRVEFDVSDDYYSFTVYPSSIEVSCV